MRKRYRKMLIILAFTGLGIFAWAVLRQHEPTYQGKPLRAWLEAYNDSMLATPDARDPGQRQQQATAIAQIGTNALPILLSMLQAKDSAMKNKLVNLIRKQTLISTHLHTDLEYRRLAVNGFDALGEIGKPVVPILISLLKDPELRCVAALSLGNIGPASRDALPILISWLTNSDLETRYCAVEALGRMGPAAREVQPALLQHLDETNLFMRITIELALGRQQAYPDMLVPRLAKELEEDLAAGRFYPARVEALGAFGVQAKEAVPVLLQILSKQQDETHVIANALKRIDPEATAKAGVK